MKEKILAMLKTKYKSLGLSDKILERYAAKIAKTVKEETEIETAVDGVEEDLQVLQSITDLHRTEIANLKKGLEPKKEGAKEGEDAKTTPDPQTPPDSGTQNSEIKVLTDLVKGLTTSVQTLVAEKAVNSRKSIYESKLKEIQGLPDYYKEELLDNFANIQFENDDQFNEFLTKKVTKATEIAQKSNETDLGGLPQPFSGSGSTTKQALSQKDLDGIVDNLM